MSDPGPKPAAGKPAVPPTVPDSSRQDGGGKPSADDVKLSRSDFAVTVDMPSRSAPIGEEDFKQTLAMSPEQIAQLAARRTAERGHLSGEAGKKTETGNDALRSRQLSQEMSRSVDLSATSVDEHDPRLPQVEGYRIVRRLGRGGMGVVYEGVQEATGRRVAVKFMLDAKLGSEAARQRFEREVDVVAALQHPGIVSVIDAGVRKGRYYFVMEFVEGKPLDESIKPGQCDVRLALELIAQVCEAVDYAHQRGVLHRDLKPSNVIIDGKGLPHLLDFGLAKKIDDGQEGGGAHGKLGLTVSDPGQLLGTIAYMSPEQSLGKAEQTSVRSDVYSLGVMGYELITGVLPIDVEGSLRDVLSRIAEQEPKPPSAHRPRLARDLDAVLLRALEKAPERRYPTAGEFAADIRRYLANMPVTARRVGAAGRTWRWVRRNQALSGVIAVATLTLVAVSAGLIVRIVQERDRANENASKANTAKDEAETNARHANQNFAVIRDILESANPDKTSDLTVRKLLDGATERLDQQPPEFDVTEASIRELLGSVYTKFGDYGRAISHLERALKIRESHAEGNERALADCLHLYAAAEWWKGDYALAEPNYVRSLQLRRALKYDGRERDIATSLSHLAACRLRRGNVESAKELYTEALQMRRELYKTDKSDDMAEGIAAALNNLAKIYQELEQFPKANELFRQSLQMVGELRGEIHSGTASASANLAACLLDEGDASGSRDAYARSLTIRQALWKESHHLTASSMIGLAQAELALGNIAAADRLTRDGIEMYKDRERTEHQDFAEALHIRGQVLMAMGKPAEALPQFDGALRIAQKVTPPAKVRIALIKTDLGDCLALQNRPTEAVARLTEGLSEIRAQRGDKSVFTSKAASRLIAFYEKTGTPELAGPYRELVAAK